MSDPLSSSLSSTVPTLPTGPLRTRYILDAMGGVSRKGLNKHLPNKDILAVPSYTTHKYPNALLSALPKPYQYSSLGFIAESMLRKPATEITVDSLLAIVPLYAPNADLEKIKKSKTTQPFIDLLIATRTKMDIVVRGSLEGESVVSYDQVEGHPDCRTATQIFEIKLTGTLEKNWTYFLYQTFAYASMDSAVTDLYVVLPLQAEVWHCNLSTWASRTKYRDALNAYAKKILTPVLKPVEETAITVSKADVLALCDTYRIGFHAPKFKTLLTSVQAFPDPRKPYQIFLGSPQSNKFSVSDADCAATSAFIGLANLKVFVHSPYIINLAADTGDNWNVSLLKKNLECANALGCKGVVVHVGKSTTQTYASALDTMRKNMLLCLESATPKCPLLLETPAGQGTEMLKPITEFIEFVQSFADNRLRLCIDTCHVFACGHDPMAYINQAGALTNLIHYNDSLEPCGSCKDRHALVGSGKIGLEKMTTIAKRCQELNLPMVIE